MTDLSVVGPSAGFLFSGVAARVLQTVWPTKLETAQLQNIHDRLAFDRQRAMELDAQSHLTREAQRDNLLLSLEHSAKLQDQRIAADIDLQARRLAEPRWPLETHAEAILQTSRGALGRPLNVIIKFSDRYVVLGSEQTRVAALFQNISRAVCTLGARTFQRFGHSILLYDEAHRPAKVYAGELFSLIHERIHTEPTACINLFIDQIAVGGSDATIGVEIGYWGWASGSIDSHTGWTVDQGPRLHLTVPCPADEAEEAIQAALFGLIASIQSTYATLTSFQAPAATQLFQDLTRLPDFSFWSWSDGWKDKIVQSKSALLLSSQQHVLNMLADRAPAIAAEAAAQVALDAEIAGHRQTANAFLDLALQYFRSSLDTFDGDAVALAGFVSVTAPSSSRLADAIASIRPLSPTNPAVLRFKEPPPKAITLREASRNLADIGKSAQGRG